MNFSNCVFCQIIDKKIPGYVLYENKHAFVLLDIMPISLGHVLIIPKQHYQHMSETPVQYLSDMMECLHYVVDLLKRTYPDINGFNYVSNEGSEAFQSVFHTHLHVIPKYKKHEGFVFVENRVNKAAELKSEYEKLLAKK